MRSRGLTAWTVGNKNRFGFLIRIIESEICVNSAYRFLFYGTENTRCSLWGLSFTQRCCWRSHSCGIWCFVVGPVFDVISKGRSVIFRVKHCKNKMKLRELLAKRHNGTSHRPECSALRADYKEKSVNNRCLLYRTKHTNRVTLCGHSAELL